MIKLIKLFVVVLVLFPSLVVLAGDTMFVAGFSKDAVGDFPKGWRARPGQGNAAEEVYTVREEGGMKYLMADDQRHQSVQIFRLAHWNLDKYPVLKWKWRAKKLPVGANETIQAKNDSACGIYISFGLIRGKALKYTWSTTAPVGTMHKKDDRMYIFVKRSGASQVGQWVEESTNVIEDAKKAYGSVPDRTLSGVAILTDGNATGSEVACDYAWIGYSE